MRHKIMPEISIIVPVYNVEQYLPRCIDSILAQTFTDFELLLIDDGSPDNCGKVCDDYAAKDARIRVFHKENGGVSSARNFGLDRITGEYVSFIDSDDVVSPRFLEILRKYADENTIPFCEYVPFRDTVSFECPVSGTVELLDPSSYMKYPILHTVVCNKLFPSAAVKTARFQTGIKNGEDTLFAYGVVSGEAHRYVYVKEKLYGYFERDNSAVNTIDAAGKENIFRVMTVMYETEKAKGNDSAKLHDYWILKALSVLYDKNSTDESISLCKKMLKNDLNYILSKKCSLLNLKEKVYLVLFLMRK